jgi:hypothetical protein
MPNVEIYGDIITHHGHRRFETNIYQTIAETLQAPVGKKKRGLRIKNIYVD